MSNIARSPKQTGALIRSARRKRDMTQAQLGEKTNLRQATISKIENGEGAVRLDTLCDVLVALGLEMALQERSKADSKDIEDIF